MSVAVLVGCAASVITLYSTVPQVLRAARTRSVEGLSWSAILLNLATATLWMVYACAVRDAVQVVNNALALALLGALAVVVMRAGVPRRVAPPLAIVFASAAASVWLVDAANAFTLAMVGTIGSSVRMLPQARLAISRAPLWGLDPWSQVLGWVGTLLWVHYGVMVGDPALALCSVSLLVIQSVVLRYRLPPRRTLASLAGGRLGRPVARVVTPIAARLPERRDEVELAA